jgi:hypothetical protein
VLVRDPVSFVGSWRSLDWRIHFHELLEQPQLVDDHLGGYVDRMRSLVGSPDWLARSCLLWEATYDVVDRAFRSIPGVHLVSYESLVQDPMKRFAEVYGDVGLTWSDRAADRIRAATTEQAGAAQGAMRWSLRGGLSRTAYRPMGQATALSTYRSRLTPEEIERVRVLTSSVAARVLPGGVGSDPSGRR